jgi:hypothetical protein
MKNGNKEFPLETTQAVVLENARPRAEASRKAPRWRPHMSLLVEPLVPT